MKRKKNLWKLFTSFFHIGILTFGGGLAMLPMFRRECVKKHHWVTEEEILDIYAISQCTPGIIAVNTATYIGFTQCGILGGIVATLGVIAPSLIIICLVASILKQYMALSIVQHALAGIRIVICAMMLDTVLTMIRKGIVDKIGILLFLSTLLLAIFTPLPLVILVILSAVAGICIKNLKQRRRKL